MMNDPTNENATETAANGPARYLELKKLVADMEADFEKFFVHHNKAAGTRVRQAMQELKNFAQAVRTEVQNIKNEGKPGGGGAGAPEGSSES